MLMIVLLFESIIGAVIATIFDDGDPRGSKKRQKSTDGLEDGEHYTWVTLVKTELIEIIMGRSPDVSMSDAIRIAEEIYAKHDGNRMAMEQEAYMVGRVIDNEYLASTAEKQYVQSNYLKQTNVDDTVDIKESSIFNPIDPAEDGDIELEDAWGFETETENLFGPEQMAISEEDIAPESDIQDWDITEPSDEISQEREVIVGDDTVSPEDEINQIEETTPFESVIYPDANDVDMDPTDDFEETLYPTEQYDISESTEDFIQWPEQELDDMADELEANSFESAAWTFDQDMSQEALTGDDSYQDIGNELNVIDFEDFLDDVSASPLDLVDDHMGVPFFQWINEPPGGEALDVMPF